MTFALCSRLLFTQLLILLLCAFLVLSSSASEEGQCDAARDPSHPSCSDTNVSPLQQEISECKVVGCIATTLATSPSFREEYFEQKPLLLHVNPDVSASAVLQDVKISWEDILDLASKGLTWGGPTNGIRLMTNSYFAFSGEEAFDASLKGTPALRAQLDGPNAIPAVQTSTLHIGAIQAVHAGASKLVLEFQRALGQATNGNLYCTPANMKTAAGLHTDRMDGYVIQSSGRKRWVVYEPVPEASNPVWGVHGNAEWGKEAGRPIPSDPDMGMVGQKVMDVVLRPGDILYVPRGFPHMTSTVIDEDEDAEAGAGDKEPSIAITINTHTESHHLVYEKLVRCAFARAGYCEQPIPSGGGNNKNGKYCPIGLVITRYARSEKGKGLRQSLPVGFLNEGGQWLTFVQKMAHKSERLMKAVLDLAEEEEEDTIAGLEDLLDNVEKLDEELVKTAGQAFHSQARDLSALEMTFAGNNDEVPFAERQKNWAQMFGRTGPFVGGFCHEGGPQVFFVDYFAPDLEEDAFTRKMSAL